MDKKENKATVSLDTMTGVGINKTIAGREYTILPVNIMDMHYVIGENAKDENLFIINKKTLEEDNNNWQLFGINITDEKRRKTFMYIINKYAYYKGHPMTEDLLIEHNWSFKEIGEFLLTWCQISD